MPVRMVEDPEEDNSSDNGGSGNGGGGGGFPKLPGGGGLWSIALSLLFRSPKIGIAVLLIGGIVYYFMGQSSATNSNIGLGCTLDQQKYDQTNVYASLDGGKNALPSKISLEQFCPKRLNQGKQGSCVAWASAYAARTILYSRATGQDPNKVAFSPAFLYNQIHLEDCQGSYLPYAVDNMNEVGALPLREFPYNDNDCDNKPSNTQIAQAKQFIIKGANRLSKDGDDYAVDIQAIKQNLAQGAPVTIGMMVGGSFMQNMEGQKVWHPERSDRDMDGFGGHAMCVMGYDDNVEGGAFQLMNSWGENWGDRGFAWVRYRDFEFFVKEAYGLYPMGSAQKPQNPNVLGVKLGLLNTTTANQYISLSKKTPNSFATQQVLPIGTKFKVEITNTEECYTYVFGQETDGTSYVLFPYTAKHSPYCGIVGTRLFPKDMSMQLDKVGNKDYIGIVVSKKELDYTTLNNQLKSSKQTTFEGKFQEVFATTAIPNVAFTTTAQTIDFEANTQQKDVVWAILELNKK